MLSVKIEVTYAIRQLKLAQLYRKNSTIIQDCVQRSLDALERANDALELSELTDTATASPPATTAKGE